MPPFKLRVGTHPARVVVFLMVLATAAARAACRSKSQSPAAPPVTADTWAVVDGRQISRDDVDKAYRRMRDTTQTLSDEEALTAKLNVLNDFIVQDILLAKAAELKLAVTDAELDAAYADAKKNISDDAFQQELSRRGLTPPTCAKVCGGSCSRRRSSRRKWDRKSLSPTRK